MNIHRGFGEDVIFQKASEDDSRLIHRWRFDARTTRFIRSKRKSFDDHDKWFRKTLRDPNEFIGFALHQGKKIGVVRLSLAEVQGTIFGETGVYLDPDLRGKGLGRGVSARFPRWFVENVRPVHLFVSVIFERNIPAQINVERRGAERLQIKVWGNAHGEVLFRIVQEYFDRGEPPPIHPPDGSPLDHLVYVTRVGQDV